MDTKLPKKVQLLIDDAIRHLWDPKFPKPDLSLLSEWLEDEAWDDVVNGIWGGYIDRDRLVELLDDATMMDYIDVDQETGITDQIRIDFARGRLDALLEETMCSIHAIDVTSKGMPPASLCIMMYYHGQGGASFYDLTVCHSIEDYLASLKPENILANGDLSDKELLKLWRKPKALRKPKSKMS